MTSKDTLTPLRAIRKKCLDCQGGSRKAVRECNADCCLREYRMGTNPKRAGIGGKPSHTDNNS